MARLDELWRGVDGPGLPPGLDVKRVKARVNAALDADQAERKIYMKQKLSMALIVAAMAAALTGSAFAATANWTGLSDWFKGDTAPGQIYIQDTVQSVSDGNYTLTVEGVAADENSAYFTITITALSDEAKAFIQDDHFNSIDMLGTHIYSDTSDGTGAESWESTGGCSYRELDAPDKYSRRFAVTVDQASSSSANSVLRVRCGYMEEGKRVEIPLTPAPSMTVKIGASGAGALGITSGSPAENPSLTIEEVTLTPFTLHVRARSEAGVKPNLRFRMADGSVLTQSQLMTSTSSSFDWASSRSLYHYRFLEIQDLENISSIIVFDTEYPLDGSAPTPVEHDPALDPFTVTRMEPLEEGTGYAVPVRELTEKLGGVCAWDPATGDVTCTYRGVSIVLHAGRDTVLVDGEPVDTRCAPAEQDGVLAADWYVFKDAWGIDGGVLRENIRQGGDVETVWHDWYIIP